MIPMTPIHAEAIDVVLRYFQDVCFIMSALVAILFTARTLMTFLTFGNVGAYGELVTDALEYFVLISLFPPLFRITAEIIGDLSTRLYFQTSLIEPDIISTLILHNPYVLAFVKLVPIAVNYIAQTLSVISVAVLVGVGPLLILLNTLLDFNRGTSLYFSSLLSFMLWPVVWNMLGLLAVDIWDSYKGSTFYGVIFWFVVVCVQIFSPFFCIYLLQTMKPDEAVGNKLSKYSGQIFRG